MNWLFLNLKFFTDDQQALLIEHVTESAFSSLSEQTQKDIKYLFTRLSSSVPVLTRSEIFDSIISLVLRDKKFFIVNLDEGASPKLQVEKVVDDYSGLKIVVRESITGESVGPLDQDPVNTGLDIIRLSDLELQGNQIYKLNILLELPVNGIATGDAEDLIAEVYAIVNEDIDTDGG